MPRLTIDNKTVPVPPGKRLVNALTDEGGIDQLHACGGQAKCTTCRVQFVSGEPTNITLAEEQALSGAGVNQKGVRLSCQMLCNDDMSVKVISRLAGSGRKDAGKRPADAIEPPPQWIVIEPN